MFRCVDGAEIEPAESGCSRTVRISRVAMFHLESALPSRRRLNVLFICAKLRKPEAEN